MSMASCLHPYILTYLHNHIYIYDYIPTYIHPYIYINNTALHRCPLSLAKFRHQGMIKSADAGDQVADRSAACLRWIKFVGTGGPEVCFEQIILGTAPCTNLLWDHKV